MKKTVDLKCLYFGTPVVLVSSLNPDGSTNIAPMSSAWWLDRTAMLGFSASSQTVLNLRDRPGCVLNLVPGRLVAAVDRLALLTGRADVPEHKVARGYTYEPDKFTAAGLTPVACGSVEPYAVGECPVQMEGLVESIEPIGRTDSNLVALEVSVIRTDVDEDLLLPQKRHYIDPVGWDPLIMKFTEYFAGGQLLCPSSLARGWDMPPASTFAHTG